METKRKEYYYTLGFNAGGLVSTVTNVRATSKIEAAKKFKEYYNDCHTPLYFYSCREDSLKGIDINERITIE